MKIKYYCIYLIKKNHFYYKNTIRFNWITAFGFS